MKNRKEEITKEALNCLVKNGLLSTSIKDIAQEIGMQQGNIYYYFENKEELVVKCAELAVAKLSHELIDKAIKYVQTPQQMIDQLLARATKCIPLMRFIVSVRVSYAYGEKFAPALTAFSNNYDSYAKRFAEKLGCDVERVRPLVYMLIVSTTNYMIFGESSLFIQQLEPIQKQFITLMGEE